CRTSLLTARGVVVGEDAPGPNSLPGGSGRCDLDPRPPRRPPPQANSDSEHDGNGAPSHKQESSPPSVSPRPPHPIVRSAGRRPVPSPGASSQLRTGECRG